MITQLTRRYYAGLAFWSRWLPVLATALFLAVVTVNLAQGGTASDRTLSLGGFFSVPEIIILFLVGPLFLTRLGNVVAAGLLVYCLERLVLTQQSGTSPALYIVAGGAAVVAVLGDRMPWLAAGGRGRLAQNLREGLLLGLTLGALAVVFLGLVKVHGLVRWLGATAGVALPLTLVLPGLVALFLGWLMIGIGYTRHLALPLLSLPTLFVLAFVSGWPSHLLVVPFALAFALSLAPVERRLLLGRRIVMLRF